MAPSKIVCIGRNYREHAKELNHPIPTEPLIFLKPPSAVLAPGEPILRPTALSQRVDHEGELGVVIGKRCHGLRDGDDVRQFILGYTCVNDVTARDLQNKDGQWSRAKGFDTFCPVGPVVVSGLDPWQGVRVQTRVNGELRQDGTTADFLFSLDVILRYISQVMTLEPGDLIATGTPAGVGPLAGGRYRGSDGRRGWIAQQPGRRRLIALIAPHRRPSESIGIAALESALSYAVTAMISLRYYPILAFGATAAIVGYALLSRKPKPSSDLMEYERRTAANPRRANHRRNRNRRSGTGRNRLPSGR